VLFADNTDMKGKFYSFQVFRIYNEETFALSKDYLKNFKILYPAGYFTLVQVTQK
jgi:hypothetical protein